jgi:uncharacterized protein YcbK (DUF882 family)
VIAELEAFIDAKGFKHFRGAELTPYWSRERNGVTNSTPPCDLWPNILPTLRVLDELRERLGAPIRLLSTYRSPAYNRAVGGERNSFHMQFRAIDFACDKGTPDEWADVLKTMRKLGVFRGGIGVYPGKGFVHVDTRGYEANWRG